MRKGWRPNIPFKWMVPLFYGAFYLWILVLVFLSPLIMLYRAVICVLAWFMWVGPTQEFLVVFNSESKTIEYLTQLESLLEGRATFLDYRQHQTWRRLSISTQLFHLFGPKPIPERFMTLYLPTVIMVRKFKWPKKFTFGEHSKREESLAALSAHL